MVFPAGGGQASWQNPQEVRSYQASEELSVTDCFENSGKFRISSLLKEMECAVSFTKNKYVYESDPEAIFLKREELNLL